MWTTYSNDHLIRSNLWSNQLKDIFLDPLFAMPFVKMITEFTDGDVFNIPSIGQAEIHNYAENTAVKYNSFDTGNFQFQITDYVQGGTYITEKMKQDSYLMSQLESTFIPRIMYQINSAMETSVLGSVYNRQTIADPNLINGARHRMVASGTNQKITVNDFAKALYALQVANVPTTNLVAIVDPSVEYELNTLTNITNVSNNPMWEGIITSGLSNGYRFIRNIYGFDIYVSHFLKKNTATETISSVTAPAGAANNLFFSAAQEATPFVGVIRQAPKVDSEYNKDFQRDEYVVTARWGFDCYRPEAVVTILSDVGQVYA